MLNWSSGNISVLDESAASASSWVLAISQASIEFTGWYLQNEKQTVKKPDAETQWAFHTTRAFTLKPERLPGLCTYSYERGAESQIRPILIQAEDRFGANYQIMNQPSQWQVWIRQGTHDIWPQAYFQLQQGTVGKANTTGALVFALHQMNKLMVSVTRAIGRRDERYGRKKKAQFWHLQ